MKCIDHALAIGNKNRDLGNSVCSGEAPGSFNINNSEGQLVEFSNQKY